MHRFIICFALSLCCPLLSLGAQVWAPGVSQSSGWYDFNKSDVISEYGTVYGMCWAAASGNVIAWWQDRNKDMLESMSDLRVKEYNLYGPNVWSTFQGVFIDDGGWTKQGINWWINGGTALEAYKDITCIDSNKGLGVLESGGFLKAVYNTNDTPIEVANNSGNSYNFARSIVDAIASGYALTLSVGGYSAHAFTLWGVEYDETAEGIKLTKAWITDSDDGKEELIGAGISFKESTISLVNIPSYGSADFTFNSVSGMRTEVASIPEPASTTLGVLALAGMALRRRRK